MKGGMKTKMRHLQILGFKVIHVSNIHCLNFSGASNVISGSLSELCLADLTVVQNDHQRHWFAGSISSISEPLHKI